MSTTTAVREVIDTTSWSYREGFGKGMAGDRTYYGMMGFGLACGDGDGQSHYHARQGQAGWIAGAIARINERHNPVRRSAADTDHSFLWRHPRYPRPTPVEPVGPPAPPHWDLWQSRFLAQMQQHRRSLSPDRFAEAGMHIMIYWCMDGLEPEILGDWMTEVLRLVGKSMPPWSSDEIERRLFVFILDQTVGSGHFYRRDAATVAEAAIKKMWEMDKDDEDYRRRQRRA